jgi:hypothetical protein
MKTEYRNRMFLDRIILGRYKFSKPLEIQSLLSADGFEGASIL